MRNTVKGSEVIFVAPPATEKGSPTFKKAVIEEVISHRAARLDLTPRNDKGEAADPVKEPLGHHTAIALHSDGGEVGTFHYPEETKAAKAGGSASANGSKTS